MVLAESDFRLMQFADAFGACNFIVTWDGNDVNDLYSAINFARQEGDRFIQEKLIEYILNIPNRNPRPKDIPAFVGRPVWAVDKHERALIGMPGSEAIVPISLLRKMILSESQPNGGNGNGQTPANGNRALAAPTNGASKQPSQSNN